MKNKVVNIIKNTFLIGFLFVQGSLICQNEANNWGFGAYAGLSFNNGTATAQTTYTLNQQEGCSSISDSLGNLLFYTDGRTVKNKNHVTMSNGFGLEGDNSSTQSALIVKQPGSNSIYYLFTISDEFFTEGLRYSIVDMSLLGGIGAVTSKNILIKGQAREKVTAIQHQNGTDFWIVTHLRGTNSFNSFLLSSTGLNMTPTVSNIGVNINNGVDAIGCIKSSINGNIVAVARWGLSIVEIFNFNKSTGGLSGLKTISNLIKPYGLEFSPNNKFLYIAENINTGSNVYQYNLLAGSATAIENSQVTLGSYSAQIGSLQLGPDYKIYVAKFNAGTLDVIDEPDSLGISCNYITNGIYLLGKSSKMGLSNFAPSILPVYRYTNQCFGDSTSFTIMQNDFDSVLWDFGDVPSGPNNNSMDVNPKHLFTDTGIFNVTLIRYKNNSSSIKSYSIYISPFPIVSVGPFNPDTICNNEGLVILPVGTPSGGSYMGNGVSGGSFNPATTGAGTYDIVYLYTNPYACINADTTTITVNSSFISNQNTSVCQGDSVLIYGNYQSIAGTYYDSLQTINGCDSVLSITLSINPVYLSNTNSTICQGDSILIYGNYQSIAGTYYYSLQTISGCDSVLSTTLTVNPLPNVTLNNFNPDTICSNSNTVTLPNGSPSGGVYSGTGVNGGAFDPNTAGLGTHSVIYTYTDVNSCINSDSTFITVEQCVGINDLANDLGILIYPNPNTGLFTIEKSEIDKEVSINLLDASSRVIINKIIPKGQQKIEVDITSYSKGVYYLQTTIGKEVFVKQILKN
ncbi:MAG: T9SS type A sorting domain-containing protein [Vicingaceae bacterium]|nr:T9SS type A sorting domain-containing protein [Vicingaceae bacterium]